ncbi:MAG TPA: ABC transporter substrate-binding protein [Acidimicrobiia bacterium]|nr:ABC transporter substrate-binding protein [Acidimicrobiia bacterium]
MKRGFALLVALCALLAACGEPEVEIELVDSTRIVSLSGDITEILFELGVGDRVVGVDVTTVAPEAATRLPIIGVGRFLTAEGVLGTDPTLVIGDTQTAPVSALGQIRAAGVTVEILEVPGSFDELYEKIMSLGSMLGLSDEAEALSRRIDDEVERASTGALTTALRVAYVYTRGPDVNLLFGDGMTTKPLIEAAGAIDAGTEIGIVGTVPVTAEALIEAAPDVIIVPAEGVELIGGIEAYLELPGIGETPAGERGAILAYPEGDFLTFGPRIADSLRLLIEDLAALQN